MGERASQRWPGVLAWALWGLFVLALPVGLWLDILIRRAGRADLAQITPDQFYFVLAVVSGATVGLVLALRRPHHPVGWLLLGFGALTTVAEVSDGYAVHTLLASPGALPGGDAAAVFSYATYSGGPIGILALALLFTPTGRLPSPRWRWVAGTLITLTVLIAPGSVLLPDPLDQPFPAPSPLAVEDPPAVVLRFSDVLGVAWVVTLLTAASSLVVRFRRARGVERQQLRWVALAAALAPTAAVVYLTGSLIGHPTVTAVTSLAPGIVTWLVPLAIGAAALQYRLYDLDRIVSRTVAYGLLTVLLGSAYAVVVLGLGQVLGRDRPSLAVAGATLAVAAAFQPARRRIQELVDRRFNRRRYDAERTIAAFSGRLRQQTDLDALTAELLTVVDQTVQPTRAALWLRPTGRPTQERTGAH